jgi:hypothetical protein
MRILSLLSLAALITLSSAPAEAQEKIEAYYVIQEDLRTNFMTNRFTGWGLGVATQELRDMSAERVTTITRHVNRIGGRVLGTDLHVHGLNDGDKLEATASGWAVRDGRHELFRRRGQLVVLFAGPAELNPVGPVSEAVAVDPQSEVSVWMRAWNRDSEAWMGSVPRSVSVSLREVVSLQRSPDQAKWTGLGALLRRTWDVALGDVQDDPEWIRARVEVQAHRLRTVDGETIYVRLNHELDEETADRVLGRDLPLDEWVLSKIGRLDAFPEVDDDTAELLERALSRATYVGDATAQDWERLRTLRARNPNRLTDEDRDFLASAARIERESSRGITDRLGRAGD